MLLPESMSRIVITGSRDRLQETIDALYRLESAHLIDYASESDEGFSIGAPMPNGSKASERLVKVRSMLNELSIKKKKVEIQAPISSSEVKHLIDTEAVEKLDKELFSVLDEKNGLIQEITECENAIKDLIPLSQLPLNLEMYRGYESLHPFVGKVRQDPVPALEEIGDHEVFLSDDGRIVALFVRSADEEAAQRALSKVGFTEIPVPEGEGPASDMVASLESRITELRASLEEAEKKLEVIKEKHTLFIASTEEELAIEVEKAEAPLRIATSEYSFVMDAWVPSSKVESTVKDLDAATDSGLYVEVIETRSRLTHDEEKAEPRFRDTPSKSGDSGYGSRFKYLSDLMSTPKYQESDPSLLIGVFLPIFFGIMLGDLGYALVFIAFGAYGLKKWESDELRIVATIALFGGIWGAIFGIFMYGEMFGMHFIGHHEGIAFELGIPDWQALLGFHFPEFMEGMTLGISKMDQATMMLKLSVYIGIFHLICGYVMGIVNVKTQHGFKEAVLEKVSWLLILIGLSAVAWAVSGMLFTSSPLEGTVLYVLAIGAVVMVAGMAMAFTKEGMNVILELPGVAGNILSYTRLAAIAMSKAGMALAFNYISIIMIAGGMGGIVGILLGFLIFLVGHLLVWVLALISCSLHGLRLQYVEFMTKFFVGGGSPYEPLHVKRRLTKAIETEV